MTRRYSTFNVGTSRLAVISVPVSRTPDVLSPAEAEVAVLVAHGLTNAQIAAKRNTSARTVANQVRSILQKLGIRNRRAVARALVERA